MQHVILKSEVVGSSLTKCIFLNYFLYEELERDKFI